MPSSCTSSQNNELFWEGSQCFKSLVICDSRFESQIAIAVKSRDLEHLARLPRAAMSMSWTNCTFLGSHWLRLSHHQFHSLRPRFWTQEIGWGFYCIHGRISAKLVWVGLVLSFVNLVVGSTPMPINCKTKAGLIGLAARPKRNVPFPPGFCLPEVGTAVSMKMTVETQSEGHVLQFA